MQNNRRVISYQSECTYCKQELVDCLLVAAPAVPDLLLCAKHLSFSANEASRSVRLASRRRRGVTAARRPRAELSLSSRCHHVLGQVPSRVWVVGPRRLFCGHLRRGPDLHTADGRRGPVRRSASLSWLGRCGTCYFRPNICSWRPRHAGSVTKPGEGSVMARRLSVEESRPCS
jgi:hypothetical protein